MHRRRRRRHHRHHRRHLARAVLAVVTAAGIAPSHSAVADPTAGYSHIDELDFHPSPDNRNADGKKYPVLRSVEPCVDGYMPHTFARYSATKPVLVCW